MVVFKGEKGRARGGGCRKMNDDYFLRSRIFLSFSGGLRKPTKRNILLSIILIVSMGLFFSNRASLGAGVLLAKNPPEIAAEDLDPLNKVGKGYVKSRPEFKLCLSDQDESARKEKRKSPDNETVASVRAKIEDTVAGYPIEKMVPYIAEKDKIVAAFLIGIAKKESGWGEHVPTKNGRDCFNYWGYKGNYNLVQGYSCFDSPEQAVEIVGGRLKELVDEKVNTPERMLVWKCGSSCKGHDPEGVRSWVRTVGDYFYRIIS